jgi:apolipoprotein N-acyltransferase
VKDGGTNRKRVGWGVVLITIGTYFLLSQMGMLDMVPLRPAWPALFIVVGLVWLVMPSSRRQVGSGLFFVMLGFWFYACINHWYGLTYRTGWPLLLVASGLEMILVALLERNPRPKEEEHHA